MRFQYPCGKINNLFIVYRSNSPIVFKIELNCPNSMIAKNLALLDKV